MHPPAPSVPHFFYPYNRFLSTSCHQECMISTSERNNHFPCVQGLSERAFGRKDKEKDRIFLIVYMAGKGKMIAIKRHFAHKTTLLFFPSIDSSSYWS